ncbi:MAG: class I adenylate-forming enzyme family protein [Candidatus Azotimanducaceae bacterium]|uniref:Fatty acid--CoA ligase n=1 Tax=OM182 bacterium TaxID=2510334 RepID=A0A520S446_9GAMM|nr:fatty acid--CoA ligase [Gammaproteobacteria bacterium]OUV67986.1 MAG: fatty acid--CoA ligase [Gammaproteobacteria bacterium TMED133]RZO77206.1 MAG: fatty acid--CoA ligase [OM182 bacterium]
MSAVKKIKRNQAIKDLTSPGTPFELIKMKVFGDSCLVFKNAPDTLGQLFEDNRSDAEFYIYKDERYTFEQIYIRSCKVAQLLVNTYGIGKGDRVAISMRNYPEWVVAFQAITSIGAIAVCMNALWQTEEMEYGLTHAGVKVLLADQERINRVISIYQRIDLKVLAIRPQEPLPKNILELYEAAKGFDATMPTVLHDADDDATILYTSGSTGHPKGVVSSHRNVINALLSWELDFAAKRYIMFDGNPPELEFVYPPAILLGIPLFHVAGSHSVLLSSYRHQRRIVAMYKWDVRLGTELIEKERITSFTAPAAMTGDLVDVAREAKRDLSSLIIVGGGGAPRAPEQVSSIAEIFVNALPATGWGMTETNAIGTGIGGEDYLERPSSSGSTSAILEVAIIDEDGNHLPQGERGELIIRGTSMFREYWNRPDANAETFIGRWFRTGDVAYLDDENFLYIVDRIKDLVIRGGENIGCGEVEAALLEHDDIVEASVYGIPDKRLGEEIGATIYCANTISEDQLREFLAGLLAKFKIPKHIYFSSDPLPRVASGKIAKRVLRDQAHAALGLS